MPRGESYLSLETLRHKRKQLKKNIRLFPRACPREVLLRARGVPGSPRDKSFTAACRWLAPGHFWKCSCVDVRGSPAQKPRAVETQPPAHASPRCAPKAPRCPRHAEGRAPGAPSAPGDPQRPSRSPPQRLCRASTAQGRTQAPQRQGLQPGTTGRGQRVGGMLLPDLHKPQPESHRCSEKLLGGTACTQPCPCLRPGLPSPSGRRVRAQPRGEV